mmetsp:Transcript_1713/g.3810  ORF Transcript_1713/g.3810 Transcript_1713/m.3810 type:complete len:477 (-) Transcript_1713:533-1963(-)
MIIENVAEAIRLPVELLQALFPATLLELILAVAAVLEPVVSRRVVDLEPWRQCLSKIAKTVEDGVALKGAQGIQRLPIARVALLYHAEATIVVVATEDPGAVVWSALQFSQALGGHEDRDQVLARELLNHSLIARPLRIVKLALCLPLARKRQLSLELVDGVPDVDPHAMAVARNTAVLLSSILLSEEDAYLVLLRGVRQHRHVVFVLVALARAACDVKVAIHMEALLRTPLKGAGLEPDLLPLVPHRVCGVLLHLGFHHRLVDSQRGQFPSSKAKSWGLLVISKCLVPDIDHHKGVGGRSVAFHQGGRVVGHPETLGLQDLERQDPRVGGLFLSHALRSAATDVQLIGWCGESPGGLHKEVASADLVMHTGELVEPLPWVRARRGGLLFIRRGTHGQHEAFGLWAQVAQGRQPALSKKIGQGGEVPIPDFKENSLPDVEGVHEVVILVLLSGTGNGNIQPDGPRHWNSLGAVVSG